ncbi:aldo/keto reductase [Altibacter sp. HG106]|uniref:aldo/keto reductase n=1 Tax=Altibacter sp. HG106 TaxID=3023937 RepID=UPI00234FD786|nr:aldo/keto reductase [Altibacter sp. HG106]MDC7993559.1 aldo/keto reductase [Altibacter sp. HG106]
MDYKKLGTTDLTISPIIFGGNIFGWTLDEKESFAILDAMFDMGIQTLDTADVYSRWAPGNKGGESETIIGKWMKDRNLRNELIICTKVGMDMGQGKIDLSEAHIRKSVEDSLRRLQTDHIDLYYSHKDDETTPPEETLGTYQELIQEGKVRYIGASNFSVERLQSSKKVSEANNLPNYQVVQPEYNLLARETFEGALQDYCLEHQLGVASYFSLASGLLSGKYRNEKDLENSSRTDYVKKHWNADTKKLLMVLEDIANHQQSTAAAVALAWIMQQKGISAPIASATKDSHLQAFKEAIQLQLTEEEIGKLNKMSTR